MLALLAGGFLVLFLLVYSEILGPLPGDDELKLIRHPDASLVFGDKNDLLGKYYRIDRSEIKLDQVSPFVVQALISAEDERFYQHKGIDFRSWFRVLIKSIALQDESAGGGSTLSQQLIKNYFPRKNYLMFSLLINKMRENILAVRLERILTKDQILEFYLNTVSFGDNTHGIEAASNRFFSVPARDLNVQQAAVLIGMLKGTYYYNPRVFPDRSRQRRDVILQQMTKHNHLTWQQADSIRALPIQINYQKLSYHEGPAPYFLAYVKQQAASLLTQAGLDANLDSKGYRIYTTLNARLQQHAVQGIRDHMQRLQSDFDKHWSRRPWESNPSVLDQAIKGSDTYKNLRRKKLSHAEAIQEMESLRKMRIFSWDGEKDVVISSIDSIRHYLMILNCGMVALDRAGAVKVWVGGVDHQYFPFDHVRESTRRQVGSTFKPFVYAAALAAGMEPCEYTSAAKTVYTDADRWAPENAETNYDLKYSMGGALAFSVNTVSVKMLEAAGIENVVDLARRAGIRSDIPPVPSIALGTPSISVLEMTAAYACFINEGRRVVPFMIRRIEDAQGKVVWEHAGSSDRVDVVDKDHAQIMLHLLQGVVNEGTAASLRSEYGLTQALAGKTGTTQSNTDGWFMALTPELSVGVWVGADNPAIHYRTTALGQGARTALPVFRNFYRRLTKDDSLKAMTASRFPPLSRSLERALACPFFKEDKTVLERIFGKKEEPLKEKKFGEPEKKKSFFRRLFD
jgi:penicillin-binding protein 1A